ncbi:MAG: transketolase C-terminal domain-containing protein, partial [Anaerotruncus rubiinfantis]
TIKPIDRECVLKYAGTCKRVVTIEEHSVIGGLGDAVADVLIGTGDYKFRKIGVQDRFGQSGKPADLLAEYGLDVPGVLRQIRSCF